MAQYSKPLDEVISELHSSRSEGLSGAQAEERLAQYGPNRLRAKKKKSNLQRFLEQFKDVMILILIAAAVVSFIVACNGHDTSEFFEPLLILVIVILNAVMAVSYTHLGQLRFSGGGGHIHCVKLRIFRNIYCEIFS